MSAHTTRLSEDKTKQTQMQRHNVKSTITDLKIGCGFLFFVHIFHFDSSAAAAPHFGIEKR